MTRHMAVLAVGLAIGVAARADDPSAPRAAASDPAEGVARRDLRPALRVDGVVALRALGPDAEVQSRVESLVARRRGAVVLLGGGGVAVSVAGALALLANVESDMSNMPFGGAKRPPDYGPALTALAVSAGLVVLAVIVAPHPSDVQEVAALWNARHPDAPVTVGDAPEPPRTETAAAEWGEDR